MLNIGFLALFDVYVNDFLFTDLQLTVVDSDALQQIYEGFQLSTQRYINFDATLPSPNTSQRTLGIRQVLDFVSKSLGAIPPAFCYSCQRSPPPHSPNTPIDRRN